MTESIRLYLEWLVDHSSESYLPTAAAAWLDDESPDWEDLALLLAEEHNPDLPAIPARLMPGVRALASYARGKEDA
jgi:hypothetical protein